jgi:hypothetical protein
MIDKKDKSLNVFVDESLLIVVVLDMSLQDFGMIYDFSALGTGIVAAAMIVNQVLLVVL